MGSFGGMEIIIVLMVVLLFFGAKRIPELARGIGQGMNEFRKASDQIKKELENGEEEGMDPSSTTSTTSTKETREKTEQSETTTQKED